MKPTLEDLPERDFYFTCQGGGIVSADLSSLADKARLIWIPLFADENQQQELIIATGQAVSLQAPGEKNYLAVILPSPM